MLDRNQKDILDGIHEGLLEMVGKKIPTLEMVKESTAVLYNDLDELETFLSGKELPYIQISESDKIARFSSAEMKVVLGLAPKGAKTKADGFSLLINVDVNESGVKVLLDKCVEGINATDFLGDYKRNPKSELANFTSLAAQCDTDRFYASHKPDALDLVGRRFDLVRQVFNLIESIRDEEGTLGVTFDTRKKRFLMYYNPNFILESALEEWAINGKRTYKSLRDCYIFTLGFLIAHEMSHIIRHNTDSNIGTLETNSISHSLDNTFQDSYINVSLGSIFKGITGSYNDNLMCLSNGVGKAFSVRSSLADGGLKPFKDSEAIVATLANVLAGVLKVPVDVYTTGFSADKIINPIIDKLVGGSVLVRITCNEGSPNFRSNNTIFVTAVNSVIKALIDGKVYSANAGLTKEEAKALGVTKKAEGALVGKKVKDKITGKIGVVISDAGGDLKIAYPDDPSLIDVIIAAVTSGAIKLGGDQNV